MVSRERIDTAREELVNEAAWWIHTTPLDQVVEALEGLIPIEPGVRQVADEVRQFQTDRLRKTA